MSKFLRLIGRRDVRNQDGATLIEYALLAGLIAAIAVTTLTTIGTKLNTRFTTVSTQLGDGSK
jgi:pilus assembly protein Flp/PilA